MASFTDNVAQLTHYTPYISTNPAEAMIYTGKALEEQYQEGLSKVNSYVSSLNGLEFAKKGAKDYVDRQLNNLKTGLSKSLAGDFSNQSLVNQIGGAARTIANDPVVETNLIATANHKSQLASIQAAEKSGKSNAANEWDYFGKYQSWLNDGKLDTGFNDRFSEYVDHKKMFLDALKEIKPSANVTQDQVRIKDGTGEIEVLNQKEHEGVDAETVQKVWNSVKANPDVQNQLSIDGRFKYKGYQDKDSLLNDTKMSYDNSIAEIDNRIKSIRERALIDKTLPAALVNQNIASLSNMKDKYAEEYNGISQMIAQSDNLDEIKTRLYNNDLSANLVSAYSWSKDKDTIVDSPLFKAHMEQAKYEFDQTKEANSNAYKSAELKFKYDELQFRKDEAALKAAKANPTKKGETENTQTSEMPVDQSAGEKGSGSFYKQIEDKTNELNQGMYQTIYNMYNEPGTAKDGVKNPIKVNPDGTYSYNVNPGDASAYSSNKEAQEAYHKAYSEARAAAYSGKNPLVASDFATLVDPKVRALDNLNYKKDQIEKPFEATVSNFKKEVLDGLKSKYDIKIPFKDKMVKVSLKPTDLVDYELYRELPDGNSEKQAAKQRLIKSLGSEAADAFFDRGFNGDADAINAWSKVSKSMSKNGLKDQYTKREATFRDIQSAYKPLQTTYILDDKDKEAMNTRFLAVAKSYNVNDNVKEINKFLSEGTAKEKEMIKSNSYAINYDKNTNKYQLEISRGAGSDQVGRVDITKQDVINLGLKPDNPFWDKFGDDLSLTKGKTTDVKGAGIVKSYALQQPTSSKYSVRYHIVETNGKYQFYIYAADKAGKQVISGVKVPYMLDEDNVMQVVNNGLKDSEIENLIKK